MPRIWSHVRLRISTRLTLWYGLTLLILLSLFALFCYAFFHTSLHRDFDRHLTHEKMQLLPFIRYEDGRPAFAPLEELRAVAYQTDGVYGTYVRLLTPDGEVSYRSPNLERHEGLPVHIPRTPVERTISRQWEGKPARTIYTPLAPDGQALQGWLEVTGYEWSLHQELSRLRLALIIGIVFSVLFAIGGGYLLARRALQPVAAMTDAANEIRATDLSARLPASFGVRDELTDLAETFNQMIGRLEASFDRERRFTDNAAHELLTPLTTMRNGIEIALRRELEPDAYQRTLRSMMLDVDEMTETVQGLLQLARVDRLDELRRAPVDLGGVVSEHVLRFRDRAAREGIDLAYQVDPAVRVAADEGRLGEVVDNLLDNALKYTPEGETVRVQVMREGRTAHLVVEDTGIGFSDDQKPHLFDRFYRADTSEVQARHGSGLGLAIVQAIVQVYGGSVEAHSDGSRQGARFDVRLPLC